MIIVLYLCPDYRLYKGDVVGISGGLLSKSDPSQLDRAEASDQDLDQVGGDTAHSTVIYQKRHQILIIGRTQAGISRLNCRNTRPTKTRRQACCPEIRMAEVCWRPSHTLWTSGSRITSVTEPEARMSGTI